MHILIEAYSIPLAESMGKSKRDLAKARTRRAIMRSALILYTEEGSCGMSMNKVAKGAGIAQPSFYNHFQSLEALQHELSHQLKENYLAVIRRPWTDMLKDYEGLTRAQFNQRCQYGLTLIFDAAFVNIDLFQRLIEDRLRDFCVNDKGLGNLINHIQEEWAQMFMAGLSQSELCFDKSEVYLHIDLAAAQVHELIIGCHQQRYSKEQAIEILGSNFNRLFANFFGQVIHSN